MRRPQLAMNAAAGAAPALHRRVGFDVPWRPAPLLPDATGHPPAPAPPAPGNPPADPPPSDQPPSNPPADPPPADRGFPENTPLAEMTVEQREAYWKHQARKHEQRANARTDYDALKAKADQWDAHQREQQTPSEKAVNDAREEGRRQAVQEANEKAAKAILTSALTSRGKTADQAAGIVAGLALAAFVTDGEVDTAKVATYLDSIAPSPTGGPGGGNGTRWPDMGQGGRGGAGQTSKAAAGLAEAQKRFQKATQQQQ